MNQRAKYIGLKSLHSKVTARTLSQAHTHTHTHTQWADRSTDPLFRNKKHLKNVGPIRHCEPFYIAIHQVSLLSHAATVARRLCIDVHDDDHDNSDNA